MGRRNNQKCILCGNDITSRYRPMPQWNILGDLCGACYGKKLTEYYLSYDDLTKRNR
jgi:hypothetical protein